MRTCPQKERHEWIYHFVTKAFAEEKHSQLRYNLAQVFPYKTI